jgi:hypothetical protein
VSDLAEFDVEEMTAEEARSLTEKIRRVMTDFVPLITRAYRGRAWTALGYESWDAYCDGELHGMRPALPRAERREQVAELRGAGMSTRAIGAAIGASQSTVQSDLDSTERKNSVGEPITGVNGKTYAPSRPTPEPVVVDAEIVDDAPPSPRAAARRPLTDAVREAAFTALRSVEVVDRLRRDDRWKTNAPKIDPLTRDNLRRALELLSATVASIAEN